MGYNQLEKSGVTEINGLETLGELLVELEYKLSDPSKHGYIEGQFPPWVKSQADAEQYAVFRELNVHRIKEPENINSGCGERIFRGAFCAVLNSISGVGYCFLLRSLLGFSDRSSLILTVSLACMLQTDDMIRHRYGAGLLSPLKALRARKAMYYLSHSEAKPMKIITAEHQISNDFAIWERNKPLSDILLGNEGGKLLQKYVWAPGRMFEKRHQAKLIKGIKNLLKHPGLESFRSMPISSSTTVSQFICELHANLRSESVRAHLASTREIESGQDNVLYVNGADEPKDDLRL